MSLKSRIYSILAGILAALAGVWWLQSKFRRLKAASASAGHQRIAAKLAESYADTKERRAAAVETKHRADATIAKIHKELEDIDERIKARKARIDALLGGRGGGGSQPE